MYQRGSISLMKWSILKPSSSTGIPLVSLFAFLLTVQSVAEEPASPVSSQTHLLAEMRIRVVHLKGGTFQMGTPDTPEQRFLGRSSNEAPHWVKLSPFYVTESKITRKQWEAVMGFHPDFPVNADREIVSSWGDCPNCPVTYVSWADTQAFIQKLKENGITARLPTEAEQEYYMRGIDRNGVISATAYPWGDDATQLAEYAWYEGNSDGHLHSVEGEDSKPPNSYGLRDALGNVWEWSNDFYGEYFVPIGNSEENPSVDPQGVSVGIVHTLRGGSGVSPESECRPAHRHRLGSEDRDAYTGFRLVLGEDSTS